VSFLSTTSTDTETAIEVKGVSKAYRIWKNPAARLKHPIFQALGSVIPRALQPKSLRRRIGETEKTPYYTDFYALKDINLTVKRGEAVGIIGRNGSGKSTLLQIIAGTLTPTTGTVNINGRVAALLELGSGFNFDFTGKENVYLNASILGLTKAEIDARYDDIAKYAEIGDFIDQPVKTYSSGMVVRLAFAVAAHVDPDILIVDEALSVGDARFQLKCARTIDRFIERGVTLLFVSHDASLVKRLCRKALLLEHGKEVYAGIPNDVINLYSKLIVDGGTAEKLADDIKAIQNRGETGGLDGNNAPKSKAAQVQDAVADKIINDERSHVQISGSEFSYGGELGKILNIEILDARSQPKLTFESGEEVRVRMLCHAIDPVPAPILAMTIKNNAGLEIYGTNTLFANQPAPPLSAGQHVEASFRFPLNIMPGVYFLSLGFVQFVGEELVVIHRRYDVIRFEVHARDRTFGIANLHARIHCEIKEFRP